jgi:hypothetical protein
MAGKGEYVAITSGQVNLTTSATLIAQADSDGCAVTVHIPGNSSAYFGNGTVTTSTGFYLDKNAGPKSFSLTAGDALYGITTSGTVTVTYLRID